MAYVQALSKNAGRRLRRGPARRAYRASLGDIGHPASVEAWRDLVTQYAGSLPVSFLMEWIDAESGGNPSALGAITEVGIFQLDLQDGPRWGGTLATLHGNFSTSSTGCCTPPARALTDDEKLLQVTSGIAYITYAAGRTQQQLAAVGADWGSDFYNGVKMQHNLPCIMNMLPAAAAAIGHPPSWSEFRAFVTGLDGPTTASLGCPTRYMPLAHFFDIAEKVGGEAGVAGGIVDSITGNPTTTLLLVGGLAVLAYLLSERGHIKLPW